MIKFTSFSIKILAIASYYVRFLTQSGKFSLFFLSPLSYAKVSKKINKPRFNFKSNWFIWVFIYGLAIRFQIIHG